MSAAPGLVARAGRALRRHRLLAAAAALAPVAVVLVLVLVLPSGYSEQVSGPFGRFPASPPAGAGQPQVIARFNGPVALDGGLALIGTGNRVQAARGTAWVVLG